MDGKNEWKPRVQFAKTITRTEREIVIKETQYDFSEQYASKETFVVSRIYMVSPREGKRYFLRLLLHHVTGAASFE